MCVGGLGSVFFLLLLEGLDVERERFLMEFEMKLLILVLLDFLILLLRGRLDEFLFLILLFAQFYFLPFLLLNLEFLIHLSFVKIAGASEYFTASFWDNILKIPFFRK